MARSSGTGVVRTVLQFCLSTLPFLAVLVYLLYTVVERGNGYEDDAEETRNLFSLMDITIVFLSFHVAWTIFAVYLLIFVPKRRYLLDRYLREGENTSGDVIVEKKKGLRCVSSRQYGYAVYSHPTKTDPPVVIQKQVRVYQPYTRERVVILRLPNRPLSGQAKIDIEIDLSKMRAERDTTLCYISAVSIFWVLLTVAGAGFCVYQMDTIPEQYLLLDENVESARRIIFLVAGINPFFAFFANSIRYLMYYNWMVHRGSSIKDEEVARNVKTNNWCGYNEDAATSFDGSDQIPYSILGEDRSYAGTIHSHNRSVITKPEETQGKQSELTVTSVEDDGTKLKALPWTNV
jgi:hypothetical protein